jgi:hypothetical protein
MSFFYSPSTRGFYSALIHAAATIPGDAVAISDDAYEALLAGVNAGQIIALLDGVPTLEAAPVVVAPPAVPASVPRRKFFQAAAQAGLITDADALASGVTVPASLLTALATLPAAEQFAAQMAILYDADFSRANPMLIDLGTAMGQTTAQIDALFTLAASL